MSKSPCHYGALPGVWDPTAPVGARWHLLDANCSLVNFLAGYTAVSKPSLYAPIVSSGYPSGTVDQSSQLPSAQQRALHSGHGNQATPATTDFALGGAAAAALRNSFLGRKLTQSSGGYLLAGSNAVDSAAEAAGLTTVEAEAAASTAGTAPVRHVLGLTTEASTPLLTHAPHLGHEHTQRLLTATTHPTTEHPATLLEDTFTDVHGNTLRKFARRLGETVSSSAPAGKPQLNASILFISDSVDKHILTYLCEYAGGQVEAVPAPEYHPSDALLPPDASGYAIHTCHAPHAPGLRLAAAYFPGVHLHGPYHRRMSSNYQQRVDAALSVWQSYSPHPPQLVVVAALLWDLARWHTAEVPAQLAGIITPPASSTATESLSPILAQLPVDLPVTLLTDWATNYTHVVQYAQLKVPEANLFVYHTTLPPRFDPHDGTMERAYLGHRVHVQQMNMAGRQAAAELGMEIVDYAEVGSRFMESQSYLIDAIHPGPLVGLEIANIYLNYCNQLANIKQPTRPKR